MDNFSKFLTTGEDLKMVLESKANFLKLYFIIALFLLTFFILFPVWKIGEQGLILWIIWLIFLIFILAKVIADSENIYLLTDKRIIHLRTVYKNNYSSAGFIRLSDIENIKKSGHNIYILSKGHKYFLVGLKEANKLYNYVYSYLKSRNLV